MKELTVKIEVDDNFEPGDCYNCPLSYEKEDYFDWEEEEYITGTTCVLGGIEWDKCPLCEEK